MNIRYREPSVHKKILLNSCHCVFSDLFALTQTCSRLSRVASDQTLWKKVETSPKPLSIAEFRKILPFLSEKTVHISIGGFLNHRNKMHNESVSPSILEVISGVNFINIIRTKNSYKRNFFYVQVTRENNVRTKN